jgi:streptogrisin C
MSVPSDPLGDRPTSLQTPDDAIAQDAASIGALLGIDALEAARRLRAQEASVPATDALARRYADRLAGISIEQTPQYRIVVLLTGDDPVPDERIDTADMTIPVVFRTGAHATESELLGALTAHQAEIRAALPHPPGLGVDPRTGELVVMVAAADADQFGAEALTAQLALIAGVPVRIRAVERPALDMVVEGGGRVVGPDPADGRRYACTTGFAVTDGTRQGIVTAAHCPDMLSYVEPGGPPVPLTMIGQWGWGYQDVQVHVANVPVAPTFYADTAKTRQRPVSAQRPRASTRAGDIVCHRGERTGYSCALVELVHFAPAGDLCGGACLPTWVTVAGPTCRGGDSGAPVFAGTVAFGIVKGGTYRSDGSCAFYFYMSADYLPAGWSLMTRPAGEGAAAPSSAGLTDDRQKNER